MILRSRSRWSSEMLYSKCCSSSSKIFRPLSPPAAELVCVCARAPSLSSSSCVCVSVCESVLDGGAGVCCKDGVEAGAELAE